MTANYHHEDPDNVEDTSSVSKNTLRYPMGTCQAELHSRFVVVDKEMLGMKRSGRDLRSEIHLGMSD